MKKRGSVLAVLLFSVVASLGADTPTRGLVVHVDVEETTPLLAHGNSVVHALFSRPADMEATRSAVVEAGGYGSVSADTFDGEQLPYADNLVNLLVVHQPAGLTTAEMLRVVVPGGTLRVNRDGAWAETIKPRPSDIDEWTHYLHSASGNPVARDKQVESPRQLQWVNDPPYARHHEHVASMNALVSANGRVFSVCDKGPMVSMLHPPEWRLSAHDAFNGLLLWERPIPDWFDHLYRFKNGPASLPRRLVAVGDRVYVTMGTNALVSVLDARTGKTITTCQGTENTHEMVFADGKLYLERGGTHITAVDAATGKVLWDKAQRATTLTLSAAANRVVFCDGEHVVALNVTDGSTLWTQPLEEKSTATWQSKDPPRLILTEKAVVLGLKNKKLYTFDAGSGQLLWWAFQPRSGYVSPKDLFVIDGLVWYGDTAGAKNSGEFIARDLMTGNVKKQFKPDIDAVWLSHHRCHISKATEQFILPGRMGVEFIDLQKQAWKPNHWVRGGCLYGVMPCNGLLYTPPHACACYFEAKQNGFSAYTGNTGPAPASSPRLEEGPAYSRKMKGAGYTDADWPQLRHDSGRSGHTSIKVPAAVEAKWSVELGGKLTQPVVANGRLYVALIDKHTLHALEAATGKPVWRFTAGGRIDSPPTLHGGRAYFGCRDGWVYCVSCDDGQLVWRYRGAPRELLMMAYGQLESAWPIHGSVLVHNGEVHCVSGRNMFMDGGLRYLRLDLETGRIVSETVMDERDPIDGGSIQKHDSWLDMTTTLPDVLSCDGESIYMRSLPFDLKGKRRRISHFPEASEPAHVFSPTGFLDDNWFHRSYWTYARCFPGGWSGHLAAGRGNPSGRLLVSDETAVYGFGRQPKYFRWTTSLEYRLFAAPKGQPPNDTHAWDKFKEMHTQHIPGIELDRAMCPPMGPKAMPKKGFDCRWENDAVPLLVRAMVSTADSLFVAGPSDVMDEGELLFRDVHKYGANDRAAAAKQAALWRGEDGALLHVVSKADGKTLATHKLEALPRFDGLIAANGRLYVSLENGKLICLDRSL